MRSICVLFVSLFVLLAPVPAQDNTGGPVLVDSFERIQCEDARARMDNFMAELANSTNDRGVIVVHPKGTEPIWAFRQLQEFLAQARFRKFDMERLDAKVGPVRTAPLIEFWRVPSGAAGPEAKASDVEAGAKYSLKTATRFGSTISTEYAGCVSMPFDIEAFVLALKNLGGVRGRIAVKGPNANKANKRIKELRDETHSHGVEEPALRTTFARARREVTELWLDPVPREMKN